MKHISTLFFIKKKYLQKQVLILQMTVHLMLMKFNFLNVHLRSKLLEKQ